MPKFKMQRGWHCLQALGTIRIFDILPHSGKHSHWLHVQWKCLFHCFDGEAVDILDTAVSSLSPARGGSGMKPKALGSVHLACAQHILFCPFFASVQCSVLCCQQFASFMVLVSCGQDAQSFVNVAAALMPSSTTLTGNSTSRTSRAG